jgi:pyruvate,water dikinase
VAQALPFHWRRIWPLLSRCARDFLDLREDLRWLLDRALWALRKAMLEKAGELGWPHDRIFFLRLEELETLRNRAPGARATLRKKAGERAAAWNVPFEPPVYLVDGNPVEEFAPAGGTLRGIGASPGRIRGRARHVASPSEGLALERDDILVAHNTDPGWTPVFEIVGGVVTEEGGLLNHASIVARELGRPAVVGVRGALRRVPDGARILIDGGRGEIRIEA